MQKISRLILVVIMLWVATFLRVIHLSDTSFDHDETLTYLRTQGTLNERLENIGIPGNHVPLFFLLTGLLPHDTDFELRLGALWFGLLGLALLIRVTHELWHDPHLTLWVAVFVTVTPFIVRFSRYARPYAMLFFFSLWASYLFLRLLHGKNGWGVFTIVSLITYLTHLAAAALPLSQFIILVWAKTPNRMLKKWLMAQLIASLPIFIWLLTYNQWGGSTMGWIHPPNLGRPYYTITHILIGYSANLTWPFWVMLPVITIALGTGVWWVICKGGWPERYWLVLTVAPLLVVFLISQVKPLYDERYFTPAASAYFLLVGLGWRHLPKGYWNAALVVFISGGLTLHELVGNHYERTDWKSSAAYIQAHVQPGDCILLDAPHRIAFSFYYPDAPHVLPYEAKDPLYAGQFPSSLSSCRRLWLMIGDSPGQKARHWLDTQHIIEMTRYPKMCVYLINYTPQQNGVKILPKLNTLSPQRIFDQ